MPIEFENAPACCKQSLQKISDILDAAGCLEELMAAAPALVKPMVGVSKLGVLWRLGTGVYGWKKLRKSTSKTLQPIVQNRVKMVIDFELINHGNDPQLSRQWSAMRTQFQN